MNEARGVPEGLTSYAKKILDKFLEDLKSPFPNNATVVNIPGTFFKNDKKIQINDVNVLINLKFYSSEQMKAIVKANPHIEEKTDELLLSALGMRFTLDNNLTKNYNLKIMSSSSPTIIINFLASRDILEVYEKIYMIIKDNYARFLDSFGHELKHFIDNQLKDEADIALRAKYQIVSQAKNFTDSQTLIDFFFDLYYLSSTENLVRPSELKTKLDNENVTKKDFKEIYYNSKMYKKFDICQNMTYEKLYNNLGEELATKVSPEKFSKSKDKLISNELSKTIRKMIASGKDYLKTMIPISKGDISITNAYLSKFKSFLKNHLFIKYASNQVIGTDKVIDTEKTYRAIIKDMNATAIKMKKKIAKLYEDVPDNYES